MGAGATFMIQLYGHPVSTCTRKVLTVLAETNTPYAMNVIDFGKGEHKQEPHLSRQPFGQVPAIDDAGFALFESRAICRYLNDKAGSPLAPPDAQPRALMEQWMSVEQSNYSGAAMKYVYHHVFNRPQEPDVLEKAAAMIEKTLSALGKPLERRPYLTGESFSLADICYMPYFEYTVNTSARPIYERFPSVLAWWERVSARPSWKKVAGRG
jgi:glutathione S-transferase